ncbi:type III secretion protein HrpB2 [Trinickia dinghuensis]|nr:type III secretion protein HrpB2 [Trinickia dinghuensis]
MDVMLALAQLQPPPPPAGGPALLQPPLPTDLRSPAQVGLQSSVQVDPPAPLPPIDAPLAARFSKLMAHDRLPPVQAPESESGAWIGQLLRNEDMAIQYVSNDMLFILQHENSMTISQFGAAAMQVQIEAGSLQVDLQAKMSVVTSSKDAIETLMKNQ